MSKMYVKRQKQIKFNKKSRQFKAIFVSIPDLNKFKKKYRDKKKTIFKVI